LRHKLEKIIKNVARVAHQLKQISQNLPEIDQKKSNYMIGFRDELKAWLGELAYKRQSGGERNVTIQQVALSILEGVKAAYECEDAEQKNIRNAKVIVDQLNRIALELADKKKEVQMYTIRLSPNLATWLSEMAIVQMQITGQKNMTAQGAAVTLLTLAHERYLSETQ